MLGHSTIVANEVTSLSGNGGAIFFAPKAVGTIHDNVITGNISNGYTGGVYLGINGVTGTVTVARTIIANNLAPNHSGPMEGRDVGASMLRPFVSLGHNRLTSGAPGFMHDSTGNGNGDFVASHVNPIPTAHYVVTGLGDSLNPSDDGVVLSLREAVHKANTSLVGAEEIWVPSWSFKLTRERRDPMLFPTDMSAEFGDLDVDDTLTIRGIHDVNTESTIVAWRVGAMADKVFELLGDFAADGILDAADWVVWRKAKEEGTANGDADDDGDTDDADLVNDNFGNTLMVLGIS